MNTKYIPKTDKVPVKYSISVGDIKVTYDGKYCKQFRNGVLESKIAIDYAPLTKETICGHAS